VQPARGIVELEASISVLGSLHGLRGRQ